MRSRASRCKRPGPGWIGRDALERSKRRRQSWGARVRLIAGSAGGRRLAVAPGGVTRPTTDRVREALFSAITSWLGTSDRPAEATLAGIAFCDLYAGSGAVGLEAASRGANPVLLVEADRRIAALAVRNARQLGLPGQGPNGARRGPTPTVNHSSRSTSCLPIRRTTWRVHTSTTC